MAGFEHDPQSERGSDCPKNYLGIVDFDILTKIERVFIHKRLRELSIAKSQGQFDVKHLKYIFQDVFPWAGEFRVVNISKGNSTFGPAMHIAAALEDVLGKLHKENLLVGLDTPGFAARAAYYLGEINAIHPFREGNGRTQREFIRQLAVQAGHPLSWAGFTQEEMVSASIVSHLRGDCTLLAGILNRALSAGFP